MNTAKGLSEFRTLLLLLLNMIGANSLSSAQTETTRDAPPTPQPSAPESQAVSSQSSSSPTDEKTAEQESKKKEEKKRIWKLNPNGSIVAAPMPIVSPALGAGIVPVLGYITPIPAKDKAIEPSVVGAGGLITDNGTRGWGVGTDIYLDKSRYEIESVYAKGNLDYNLYGVGFVNGNAGFKLPLEQAGHFFFFKTLRRIGWDFYGGHTLHRWQLVYHPQANIRQDPLPFLRTLDYTQTCERLAWKFGVIPAPTASTR